MQTTANWYVHIPYTQMDCWNPTSSSDFFTSHESRQTKKTSEKSYKNDLRLIFHTYEYSHHGKLMKCILFNFLSKDQDVT